MIACLSGYELAHNGFGLGEGGDFHHKCLLDALLFVYPQNSHRSTSPPLLPNPCFRPGVLVVRVLQPLSILSFATNCPSANVSDCVVAFLKFLEGKEIFNFFFSVLGRHTLFQASVCVSACAADSYVRLTAEMYPRLLKNIDMVCLNVFPELRSHETN